MAELVRDLSLTNTALSIGAGLTLFILASYFTAPIRDA